jgi:hypothetical protein
VILALPDFVAHHLMFRPSHVLLVSLVLLGRFLLLALPVLTRIKPD